MITVATAVKNIVEQCAFLEEGISKNIINYSALARDIKPKVEKKLFKKIKTGALIMALRRLSKKQVKYLNGRIFKETPDMIVKTKLMALTFLNSLSFRKKHKDLINQLDHKNKYFITITQGVFETTIIASDDLRQKLEKIFKKEKIISRSTNLSSITIKLPKEMNPVPGVFYFVLKALAYEGVNIVEVVSTLTEFTIVLNNEDVDKAFSILKTTLAA